MLINGTLWDDIVDQPSDRYRRIVPELPFGAHRTPMLDDADLRLESLVKMVADFLREVLGKRMERFGLRLHPEKTRLIAFERPKAGHRDGKGPGTFDFHGFTMY